MTVTYVIGVMLGIGLVVSASAILRGETWASPEGEDERPIKGYPR